MTFRCERCGSTFSPIRVSGRQNCPRCRARDRVSVELVLEMSPFSALWESSAKGEGAPVEQTRQWGPLSEQTDPLEP
jgi:hypothetical protein